MGTSIAPISHEVTVQASPVRAFTPGERLVLAFAIGPDRKPVPNDAASEIEVRFSAAGPGRTRVAIEHRDFGRYGRRQASRHCREARCVCS